MASLQSRLAGMRGRLRGLCSWRGRRKPQGIVEMPKTPTGKILHRILREKYGMWKDHQ